MNDNVASIESTSKGRLLPDFKISEELSDMIVVSRVVIIEGKGKNEDCIL